MFTHELNKFESSAFLLGPRGTGKSTWIHANYKANTAFYDLLNTTELVRLSRDPSLLYQETAHLPPDSWVIVDEVQKVPALLNEVHRIIEEKKIRFILSGSSARKLREAGESFQVLFFRFRGCSCPVSPFTISGSAGRIMSVAGMLYNQRDEIISSLHRVGLPTVFLEKSKRC